MSTSYPTIVLGCRLPGPTRYLPLYCWAVNWPQVGKAFMERCCVPIDMASGPEWAGCTLCASSRGQTPGPLTFAARLSPCKTRVSLYVWKASNLGASVLSFYPEMKLSPYCPVFPPLLTSNSLPLRAVCPSEGHVEFFPMPDDF